MSTENLYIVLGCFGRIDDSFVSCRAVENRILLLNDGLLHYDDIMDYLDNLRLFDRPLFDTNAIRHFIYNMQNRYIQHIKPLWPENRFRLFEKFIIDHKACGTYIKLSLVSSDYDLQEETSCEIVDVKATSTINSVEPCLKVVKSRR